MRKILVATSLLLITLFFISGASATSFTVNIDLVGGCSTTETIDIGKDGTYKVTCDFEEEGIEIIYPSTTDRHFEFTINTSPFLIPDTYIITFYITEIETDDIDKNGKEEFYSPVFSDEPEEPIPPVYDPPEFPVILPELPRGEEDDNIPFTPIALFIALFALLMVIFLIAKRRRKNE